jgi:hypothetical protein
MKTIKDLPEHGRARSSRRKAHRREVADVLADRAAAVIFAHNMDGLHRVPTSLMPKALSTKKRVRLQRNFAVPADLQALHHESAPKAQARRRRFFESSAGFLQAVERRK